jgi:hypothetical protein
VRAYARARMLLWGPSGTRARSPSKSMLLCDSRAGEVLMAEQGVPVRA